MNPDDLKNLAISESDRLREEMVALSRDLYDHPELSGEEHRSAQRLAAVAREHGFEVQAGLAGLQTAFLATAQGTPGAPRLAFLAEYDALPDIGHGCGHNFIASAGLFAGIVARRLLEGRRGTVAVVGTPAEETFGGKAILAREGVFDSFDAALMVHPAGEDRAVATSLACSGIEVEFQGRAAHAVAHPEKGINALDALLQLFLAIDAARKGWGPEVKIPGVILHGGVRPNIVPERAVGQFSVRAETLGTVRRVREQVERMVEGIAIGTGTRYRITPTDHPYHEMVTNGAIARLFAANLVALGRTPMDGPRRNQGSLDMGNVSTRCPSVHGFLAICPPTLASHTREFGEASVAPPGEEALLVAVKAMAMTAADLISWRHLVKEARDEFEARQASAVAPRRRDS